MYVPRDLTRAYQTAIKQFPAVLITGPRQSGKSTFLQHVSKNIPYMTFDDPLNREFALQDPNGFLDQYQGAPVILDEIQRLPEIYPVLRVLVDRPRNPVRFLVLGSASPHLLRQSSESLAGRIIYHELTGFSLNEVGMKNHGRLWFRGGMPRSFLARSHRESDEWRRAFIRTFLERDIPELGINIGSTTLS